VNEGGIVSRDESMSPSKQEMAENTRFVSLGKGLAGAVDDASSSEEEDDDQDYMFEKMSSNTRRTHEFGRPDGVRESDAEAGGYAQQNGAGGAHVQGDTRQQQGEGEGDHSGNIAQEEVEEEEEDTQAAQQEEEDDHNYEITDFSLATPWERLVRDVEDVLARWGLANGGLGSGWETLFPPTREHTILNSSKTRGVMHRCERVQYRGITYLVRHVCWLPEGTHDTRHSRKAKSERYTGLCGVEALWNKRSSAATTTNYVHELGCSLGVANYVIFVPDDSQGGTHRVSLQEVTTMRSTLAIAMQNIRCVLCGITPSGPRGTPSSYADFPYTFHGFQAHHGQTTRFCCYLDAQVQCRAHSNVVLSVSRPQTVCCLHAVLIMHVHVEPYCGLLLLRAGFFGGIPFGGIVCRTFTCMCS
jgi:hypothetical protein